MKAVFADTLYWVAVARPDDQWHEASLRAKARIGQARIVTTDAFRQPHQSYDRRAMNSYQDRVSDILASAQEYHDAYSKAETFRGPSLYFHRRALETRQPPSTAMHLEYVYATLACWGMHRMGKGGSKMKAFDVFCRSIGPLKEKIAEAQHLTPQSMGPRGWDLLEAIFRGIEVMATGTRLVGNSKVMHHMMPNIVPPIDREYTLRYLRGNKNIRNDADQEWQTMKEVISGFFIPIARHAGFDSKAKGWMARQDKYPWDTSVMKIIDNLVIGALKLIRLNVPS